MCVCVPVRACVCVCVRRVCVCVCVCAEGTCAVGAALLWGVSVLAEGEGAAAVAPDSVEQHSLQGVEPIPAVT